MKTIRSVRELKGLKGKRIILRSDLNVPIENGKIMEEYKLVRQLITVRHLIDQRAKVIMLTHLGRPKPGIVDQKYSTAPLAKRLSALLGKPVLHIPDTIGLAAGTAVAKMREGEVILLENVRFLAGEEENDKKLAKRIAALGDIYVNDAFAVSHRAHASVAAIQTLIPSYGGLLLSDEVRHLEAALHPKKPLTVVIGGAKLETKVKLIRRFLKVADHVLIGGAIANGFLSARGYPIGKSLCSPESVAVAKRIVSPKIILPLDVAVSPSETGVPARAVAVADVKAGDHIFDIGPKSIRLYASFIVNAKTVLWNGPIGFFELKPFRHGTLALAKVMAARAKGKALGIAGGGETVEALRLTKMMDYIDWVSTAGGAMLDYLSGEKMPGLIHLYK